MTDRNPPSDGDIEVLPPGSGPPVEAPRFTHELQAEVVEPRRRRSWSWKRFFSYVPGVSYMVGLWSYMQHDDTPPAHTLMVMGAIVYLLWPLDLIKDFLPLLGFADDLAVFFFLVQFIGSARLRPFHRQARRWMRGQADSPHLDPGAD